MSPLHHIAAALRNVGTIPSFMAPRDAVLGILRRDLTALQLRFLGQQQTVDTLQSLTASNKLVRELIVSMDAAERVKLEEMKLEIGEIETAIGLMASAGFIRKTEASPIQIEARTSDFPVTARIETEDEAAERLVRS